MQTELNLQDDFVQTVIFHYHIIKYTCSRFGIKLHVVVICRPGVNACSIYKHSNCRIDSISQHLQALSVSQPILQCLRIGNSADSIEFLHNQCACAFFLAPFFLGEVNNPKLFNLFSFLWRFKRICSR